ncbi:MAG: biopolymer transporter ExbD [Acidobacteriota bacterium]|nr:biopolymer transporter ExbD [Acidobacteriota bacterium]
MLYKPTKGKRSIIVDLSPLIDVVFLLLIFLMVSTRFIDDHGLDLALPGSESRREAETEHLTVFVDKEGKIYVGEEQFAPRELEAAINKRIDDYDDKMVVLKVDKSVSHGKVVFVMDAAKSAGASGLTFATMAPSTENRQ